MSASGPSSMGGSKYQGFGSADLAKYSGGYNLESTKNSSGYDPYKKKGGSLFDGTKESHEKKSKETKKKTSKKETKKKTHKKKKSESEEESNSENSDEEESSEEDSSEEEENPKNKKKAKAGGLSKPKTKGDKSKADKKEVRFVENEKPQAKKQDLLELIDTCEAPVQETSASATTGLEGLYFGPPSQPTSQSQNIFANMNIPASNQPNINIPPSNQNNMFANMNFAASSQPQRTDVNGWSTWGVPQQPVQQNIQPPAASGMTDLFGNMNLNQAPTQPAPKQPTSSGFDMFSGMNQTQLASTQSASPNLLDDFGEFQDSEPVAPQPQAEKSKKDDAWAMGGGLFNLSGLKKDSEKKDKLSSSKKVTHHDNNLLHTKGENLDSVWGAAYSSSSTGYHMGGPTMGTSSGYNNSGFGGNTGFGQSSSGFGGSNQGFSSGFGGNSSSISGFDGGSSFVGGFGAGSNSISGFSSSGFPNQQQNYSNNSGFSSANTQSQQNTHGTWGFNQGNSGFPNVSSNQPGQNTFF
jgi:hypothetical protein